MANSVNSILKQVLSEVEPSKEEIKLINKGTKDFVSEFKKILSSSKTKAEIFVGGSYAKGTMIKKGVYDIDVFVRFDKDYSDDEISDITEGLLKKKWVFKRVHGSRDYFQINVNEFIFIEVVPVRKINKPSEAVNTTDLSYSHVKWINKKVKTKKILDDIKLAKAFMHGCNCYGAESYVKGFSGYSIELLVYRYKGFMNFLKAIVKAKNEKIFIDIEKYYKNKNEIMIEINNSKLHSPIIVIDPTFKERNALAALSKETFDKFIEYAQEFLKKPSMKFFNPEKINLNVEKNYAEKRNLDFVIIKISTERQEGDIAGSKLLKFYEHLSSEISRFFDIKKKGFEYDSEHKADIFFSAKPKKEIIFFGPFKKDKVNAEAFRKKHKGVYEKAGRLYAQNKIDFNLKSLISDWKNKYRDKVSNMDINELRIM